MNGGRFHVASSTGWSRAAAAVTAVASLLMLVVSCAGAVHGSPSPDTSSHPAADRHSTSAQAAPGSAASRPAPSTGPASPKPAGPPYAVGVRDFSVAERSRQVEIGGHVSDRVIPVVVRYPARSGQAGHDSPGAPPAAGAFPLVVFAPGYLQCGSAYAPLLRSWTAAGFVVAEVRFPLTDCTTPDPNEADIVHQPADVSSVIAWLLGASAGYPLHGLIDPHRVAIAGHSDGGDTVAAAAFNTCCRDSRVAAAVVLAGAGLSSFGGSYFPRGSPPVLFVQGTADTINPPADTQQLYQDDQAGPKGLLSIDGAGHLSPYEGDGPAEQLVARLTTDFLRMTLLGSRTAAQSLAREGTITGQSALTTSGLLPAG